MAALPRDDVDAFRVAEELEPDLREVSKALEIQEGAAQLCEGAAEESLGDWLARIVRLMRTMESCEGSHWDALESSLLTFSSAFGPAGVGVGDVSELLEIAELADLVEICGQSYRAAPHSRDLVGRFFQKSIATGSFFRDVRMTPVLFDEVVKLVTPYLPCGQRGLAALPPAWRVFAVLFWLAQGGRQRVVARAVNVAESTFGKFCAPVVRALCVGLSAPTWPGRDERRKIELDFSKLSGGNHAGWKSLYCGR